jgi:hypothetical protein
MCLLPSTTFNFKEGDRVRLLETKGLFEKSGAKGWSKKIYEIYDVQENPAASSSRVTRYFLADSDGPLTFIDKKDKAEKPAWFMGYQLQPAGKGERPKGYSESKAKRSDKQEAEKKQKAKQRRGLAKEGLDDAQAPLHSMRLRGKSSA